MPSFQQIYDSINQIAMASWMHENCILVQKTKYAVSRLERRLLRNGLDCCAGANNHQQVACRQFLLGRRGNDLLVAPPAPQACRRQET